MATQKRNMKVIEYNSFLKGLLKKVENISCETDLRKTVEYLNNNKSNFSQTRFRSHNANRALKIISNLVEGSYNLVKSEGYDFNETRPALERSKVRLNEFLDKIYPDVSAASQSIVPQGEGFSILGNSIGETDIKNRENFGNRLEPLFDKYKQRLKEVPFQTTGNKEFTLFKAPIMISTHPYMKIEYLDQIPNLQYNHIHNSFFVFEDQHVLGYYSNIDPDRLQIIKQKVVNQLREKTGYSYVILSTKPDVNQLILENNPLSFVWITPLAFNDRFISDNFRIEKVSFPFRRPSVTAKTFIPTPEQVKNKVNLMLRDESTAEKYRHRSDDLYAQASILLQKEFESTYKDNKNKTANKKIKIIENALKKSPKYNDLQKKRSSLLRNQDKIKLNIDTLKASLAEGEEILKNSQKNYEMICSKTEVNETRPRLRASSTLAKAKAEVKKTKEAIKEQTSKLRVITSEIKKTDSNIQRLKAQIWARVNEK